VIPEYPKQSQSRSQESRDLLGLESPSSSVSLSSGHTPTPENPSQEYQSSEIFSKGFTNPTFGEPGVLPKEIQDMKKRRRGQTIFAGVAGGMVGLVALGPIGAVAGGVGGAMATKGIGKRMEKRMMNKIAALQIESELENAPEIKVYEATYS